MKVKELIVELQKFDPEADIEIPLKCYTSTHPDWYAQNLYSVTKSPHDSENVVRINVSLPKGIVIQKRTPLTKWNTTG